MSLIHNLNHKITLIESQADCDSVYHSPYLYNCKEQEVNTSILFTRKLPEAYVWK